MCSIFQMSGQQGFFFNEASRYASVNSQIFRGWELSNGNLKRESGGHSIVHDQGLDGTTLQNLSR